MKTLHVDKRGIWRAWLAEHHACEREIWLIFYKTHTRYSTISYDDAVEEALCFGWIDGLIKRIDHESYVRKFMPRRLGSAWSEANKKRVDRLVASGLMTDAGRILIDEAKSSGEWDRKRTRPNVSLDILPDELVKALEAHPKAAIFFRSLPPSCQKQYVLWIATAKRTDTRTRRAREAIAKLESGERLGLK